MSGNFFNFNLIHIHYHPSIHPSTMPELSAVEHLAKLQATKKRMEKQEAELNVAAEEEQRAAERNGWLLRRRQLKSCPRSGRLQSPPLGRRRKVVRHLKRRGQRRRDWKRMWNCQWRLPWWLASGEWDFGLMNFFLWLFRCVNGGHGWGVPSLDTECSHVMIGQVTMWSCDCPITLLHLPISQMVMSSLPEKKKQKTIGKNNVNNVARKFLWLIKN